MGYEVPYQRPPQIEICYEAARKGDVAEVKKQVNHLLHEPQPTSAAPPDPAWLSDSLDVAIQHENLEIVQILLNEDVARGDLPIESAVRQRAKGVLELFLQYGWDINKPLRRNEPPALRYALDYSREHRSRISVYLYLLLIKTWLNGLSVTVLIQMPAVLGI